MSSSADEAIPDVEYTPIKLHTEVARLEERIKNNRGALNRLQSKTDRVLFVSVGSLIGIIGTLLTIILT